MAASPSLVLEESALHFLLSLRGSVRRRVLLSLERLRDHHWLEASEYALTDKSGRHLNVSAAHPFLITWWHDGAVDELRVVDIQRVRY